MKSVFGDIVQLYITGKCGMKCFHCNSRKEKMEDMTTETLKDVAKFCKKTGIKRIELFANDPLLHSQIEEFIKILNRSKLKYGLLTVGKSPSDPSVWEKLKRIIDLTDPLNGSLVFSVDYTERMARKIVGRGPHDKNFSQAFKSLVFWESAKMLREKEIPVRINVVISRNNIDEVELIMLHAAKMEFAVSFCFVQNVQKEFGELLRKGFTPDIANNFRNYLRQSGVFFGR